MLRLLPRRNVRTGLFFAAHPQSFTLPRLFLNRPPQPRTASTATTAAARQHANPPTPRRRLPRYIVGITLGVGASVAYNLYAEHRHRQATLTLDPDEFASFTLVAREPASDTSSVFVLKPGNAGGGSGSGSAWNKLWQTCMWSVEIKQPQLQIARSYTPLPPPPSSPSPPLDAAVSPGEARAETSPADESLRLLVRHSCPPSANGVSKPCGEMTSYLSHLPIGASVELRGPHVEYLPPLPRQAQGGGGLGEKIDKVVFLAGGTGIAPALQAARLFLGADPNPTGTGAEVHVVWSVRRKSEIEGCQSDPLPGASSGWMGWLGSLSGSSHASKVEPDAKSLLVREIEALQKAHPGRLKVSYLVDEESQLLGKKEVRGLLNEHDSAASKTPVLDKMLFISGPEGYISYVAGPKVWQAGRETQGQIGGLLDMAELRKKGWGVWKL